MIFKENKNRINVYRTTHFILFYSASIFLGRVKPFLKMLLLHSIDVHTMFIDYIDYIINSNNICIQNVRFTVSLKRHLSI